MPPFQPSTYWEERLRAHPGLLGTGYTSLGEHYNEWLYRVKRRVICRVVRSAKLDLSSLDVLDVGSGTGFLIDVWKSLGAKTVVGADITAIATENLRTRFPDDEFYQLDIGDTVAVLQGRLFDVVCAFDVLYHIVDDDRFARAISNIAALLRPGGLFFFSDLFLHREPLRLAHCVSRTLEHIERTLCENGFQILRRSPLFVIMNSPLDTRARAWRLLWRAMTLPATKSEVCGALVGGFLYPFELALTACKSESPTTEVMVCRKSVLTDESPYTTAGAV